MGDQKREHDGRESHGQAWQAMTANYNPYIVSDYAPTTTMGEMPRYDNIDYTNQGYLQYLMSGQNFLPEQFYAPEFDPTQYPPPRNDLKKHPNIGGIESLMQYLMAKK